MKRLQSLFFSTILIASIASFGLGWFFAKNVGTGKVIDTSTTPPTIGNSAEAPQIHDLGNVWQKLNDSYYDASKIELSKLGFGAVKGLVAALGDPYTEFMPPEESKEFEDGLDGQVEGIGAELQPKDGKLVVSSTLKNSPAEKAGLKKDDIILKINDQLAETMTLYDAVKQIRGKKGTSVKLMIVRGNLKDPFEVTVVREEIQLDTITLTKLDNDIFHLELNQFNDHTKNEFQNAIQKILLEKPRGVIIDVRGNGGGYLDIAVDLLSELIPGEKPAVIIKKRDTSKNETLKTSGDAKLGDVPLVVLIDKGSASASEILAGALQDYKRAVIIGETSYGKGTVQEVDEFEDGSRLRMTIAHWFTPLDRSIDKTGIKPDVEVKMTDDDIKQNRDPQLDEAIRYLKTK